jgi:hypothetical protein
MCHTLVGTQYIPTGRNCPIEKDYKVTASGLKYAILKPGTGIDPGEQE